MTPLKKAIFEEIRKTTEELRDWNDEQMNNVVFHHPAGLRLSRIGYQVVKKLFTAYAFEFPETIVSKHQLSMGKLEYPYYLTKRRMVLFSEMDAAVVKLHGGIQSFLEVYIDE